ncbi:gephyrin-like molybdotransferase Glp [Amylibacter sp. IMCC11727]|uniref:molybdopterin molybdotransferase MoeA n=1 Tax=Amylibacter sp. IMCC11727 TaxID=3039851 RepID=UPI00244DC13C|nr:gephyrin-like molybdotransferase Glp [Amylibacter sp. IMCC11727]WGI20477.1 molybdopterin molybdotransferase MoeA [Amylibacter sp. IMCC11727]
MITVDDALSKVLDLFSPLSAETVPLRKAAGRVLAADAVADRDQPPFASSAMDGYAVQNADLAQGATLTVIGESAAGSAFDGAITSGQAVRIFTGAPVPVGADRILIQEDCTAAGETITVGAGLDESFYIRPAGGDFKRGDIMAAPRVLSAGDIALLASMNCAQVRVVRKPRVALVATGDELVMPGESPSADQIISSNNFGLKALVEANGGSAQILPIASDSEDSLAAVLQAASSADVIVTLGGASVGDHDLVRKVATKAGLEQSFYKVAMRPGKPLMAGRLGDTAMIGLPGNPVSSMVCGTVFLIPALRAMLGLGKSAMPREVARLGRDIASNGPRSHYMRAQLSIEDGLLTCTPETRQDSSLLSVLSRADALMVRDPDDAPRVKGDTVEFIRL